jgi:anthranilate/para-aminobenzoate synthase component II
MGICLGHQCIGEVFGARIIRAKRPVHGKTWEIFHDGKSHLPGAAQSPQSGALSFPYRGGKEPFRTLGVSAFTHEGEIMGLRNSEMMLEGVQFHPESIGTAQGMMMFDNFLSQYVGWKAAA